MKNFITRTMSIVDASSCQTVLCVLVCYADGYSHATPTSTHITSSCPPTPHTTMNWSILFDGRNLRSNIWSTKYIIKPAADCSVTAGDGSSSSIMSLCRLTTTARQNIIDDSATGQSCCPVLKQDEDICDYLLDHGSLDTGNIEPAVTGMIHDKVHSMIVTKTTSSPPPTRADYIKTVASIIVEHCFRRYWCERPDDATCANLYQDLTRIAIMNRLVNKQFKAAFEALIKEYNDLVADLHVEYQGIALNDYQLGTVRLPLDKRLHADFNLHLRPSRWEQS
jgi:hypothetical protein